MNPGARQLALSGYPHPGRVQARKRPMHVLCQSSYFYLALTKLKKPCNPVADWLLAIQRGWMGKMLSKCPWALTLSPAASTSTRFHSAGETEGYRQWCSTPSLMSRFGQAQPGPGICVLVMFKKGIKRAVWDEAFWRGGNELVQKFSACEPTEPSLNEVPSESL